MFPEPICRILASLYLFSSCCQLGERLISVSMSSTPSSLHVDAVGTPFLLPSRGARAAGAGGRKGVAPSVRDGSLDHPQTKEGKGAVLRELTVPGQQAATSASLPFARFLDRVRDASGTSRSHGARSLCGRERTPASGAAPGSAGLFRSPWPLCPGLSRPSVPAVCSEMRF